jgi:excisionase family DNA binding protein
LVQYATCEHVIFFWRIKMKDIETKFYKTSELAKLLNIVPATLKRWVKRGIMPAPTMMGGRTMLFDRAEVSKFLER